ncbi:MarR family winged helix-turn-helix transcriptional regulator [Leucobacter sp. 1207-22]|uniref:MarR family winged helix-turn-helix transcriptional regulator n=1 Tax=Leucobacter sp. 1207-22 TaxID=2604456 RepID=UPI004063431F
MEIDTKHELLSSRTSSDEASFVMGMLTTVRMIDAACTKLLSAHGLTEGRFAALLAVSDEPGISPARLADRIGVIRATVTGLTDGLVKAGLIERAADTVDRRAFTLTTTQSGEELLAKLVPEYATWLTALTAGTTPREIDAASLVMSRMQENLNSGTHA